MCSVNDGHKAVLFADFHKFLPRQLYSRVRNNSINDDDRFLPWDSGVEGGEVLEGLDDACEGVWK